MQGILALRLANGVFEPVWNRNHIASMQIDVPEAIGLEGRAGFYEETGAFRDMVVTHLAQVLGFLAMDRPASLDATALQDAKAAVFADLRRFDPERAVFGQYEGFREEEGIDPESTTETFVALRAEIDDDRWRGVPFLLRTGKALAEGRRVVTVTFRDPGRGAGAAGGGRRRRAGRAGDGARRRPPHRASSCGSSGRGRSWWRRGRGWCWTWRRRCTPTAWRRTSASCST